MHKIVFLLVPNVHLLDLAGPAQVFSTAASFGYPYELHYVAEQEKIEKSKRLALKALPRL